MGNKSLEPSVEGISLEKHPSLALEALDANIGANSYYLPLMAAAGMCFTQPNHVANLYIHSHPEVA
jgi:hypothetical protein